MMHMLRWNSSDFGGGMDSGQCREPDGAGCLECAGIPTAEHPTNGC